MSDHPHVYLRGHMVLMGHEIERVCDRCALTENQSRDCPVVMREEIAALREQLSEAEAKANAILERVTTADAPWRLPGCECEVDSKPADRCNVRWTRCSARLSYLRATKTAERA